VEFNSNLSLKAGFGRGPHVKKFFYSLFKFEWFSLVNLYARLNNVLMEEYEEL
jgi:hypothetical protein